MGVLIVPDDGDVYWPTLGWRVAEFLTGWDYLRQQASDRYEGSIYGPGSLKGMKYQLDGEKLAATLRAYEVYPPGHRFAGMRRFKRVGLSWRKGTAKTEWAAQIAYGELHPEGPVRAEQVGNHPESWEEINGIMVPKARAVRDPYIPMMAYTEEQTEELAYGALMVIISEGPDGNLFDVGKDRILRLDGRGMPDGKAVALAGSPNAADGARTTFQHFDETHRLDLPRLVSAHKTMLANIPKRPMDDPWSLETTTAGRPGASSVAEGTHKYANAIKKGEVKNPRLFYFHREASAKWDMRKFEDRVEAVREATGPTGEYAPGQFEEIAGQWDEPDADRAYLERVWCNRWTQADSQAFDVIKFEALANAGYLGYTEDQNLIKPGAFCTLGFDGARFKDSTSFVLTEIATGKQQCVGLWERPMDLPDEAEWEVPVAEVHEKFAEIMRTWTIHKLYGDPPHWVEDFAKWAAEYPDVVVEWWTNRRRPMSQAARNYAEAINSGQIHPSMSAPFAADLIRHVGNAGKVETNLLDEEGRKVWILGKLRPELKFDAAMAAVLSWQARIDALSDGASEEESYMPTRLDRGGQSKVRNSPDVTAPALPGRGTGLKVRMGRDAVLSGR